MEMIKTTKKELIRINNLIAKIRITREEWCDLIDNENLKEINTFKKKSDSEIIIEALNGFLCDEEWEVKDMYDKKEEENDKTN